MVNSQNGWPANRRDLVSSRPVPGTERRLTVRNGAAGDLLLEVAGLFDRLVRRIDDGELDDWGYAERPIRGSAAISNHASGTAIDLNATCWSLGQSPEVYLRAAEIDVVRRIVAATGHVVRWGGDYKGRKDPMHFEINDNRSEADCARALAQLRAAFSADAARPAPPAPPAPTREDDPMIPIPLRVDEHGRFAESITVDGGGTRYVATSTLLLASEFGGTRFTVTARDHTGAEKPLYGWTANLRDHGFTAIDVPAATRLLIVEGDVDTAETTYDTTGAQARRATRPSATLLVKAA